MKCLNYLSGLSNVHKGVKRSNAFSKVIKLVNDEAGMSTNFLTKTCHTFHLINAGLSMEGIKHLCCNWHESHFLLIEVSGCLHTLRLVRATLTACLYARALSSAQSAAKSGRQNAGAAVLTDPLKQARVVCDC